MFCYSTENATGEQRKGCLDEHKYQLDRIDKRLASQKFTMGDHFTGADIFLFETFWMMSVMHKETAESYTNIARVAKNVEEQEWFKKYRASSRWHNQLNGDEAFINNKTD